MCRPSSTTLPAQRALIEARRSRAPQRQVGTRAAFSKLGGWCRPDENLPRESKGTNYKSGEQRPCLLGVPRNMTNIQSCTIQFLRIGSMKGSKSLGILTSQKEIWIASEVYTLPNPGPLNRGLLSRGLQSEGLNVIHPTPASTSAKQRQPIPQFEIRCPRRLSKSSMYL